MVSQDKVRRDSGFVIYCLQSKMKRQVSEMANSPVFFCKNCGRPLKNPAEGCPCIEQGIGFPVFRPPEEKKGRKKRRRRRKTKIF